MHIGWSEYTEKAEKNDVGKRNEKRKSHIRALLEICRDIGIAALIVVVIILSLYAYAGVWPPLVVVESRSMTHGFEPIPDSKIGTIDAGDMVIVKKVSSKDDIITYVKGEKINHRSYGSYGDVIVYKKYGLEKYTPVIHRAILWLEYNSTYESYDIPEMGIYNSREKISLRVEHLKESGLNTNIQIDIEGIFRNFEFMKEEPHNGFITMGDHNPNYDQQGHSICMLPVKVDWIIGKAEGELPWIGAVKLWFGGKTEYVAGNTWGAVIIIIILIVIVPIIVDSVVSIIKKRSGKKNKKISLRPFLRKIFK